MKSHGFRVAGDVAVCVVCGAQAVRRKVWRCPKCQPAAGLGDLVAAGLKRIGVTEERVKAVTGLKDCGCGRRRQALNALGKKLGIGVDGK